MPCQDAQDALGALARAPFPLGQDDGRACTAGCRVVRVRLGEYPGKGPIKACAWVCGLALTRLWRRSEAEDLLKHAGRVAVLHEGGAYQHRLGAGLAEALQVLRGAEAALRNGERLASGDQRQQPLAGAALQLEGVSVTVGDADALRAEAERLAELVLVVHLHQRIE